MVLSPGNTRIALAPYKNAAFESYSASRSMLLSTFISPPSRSRPWHSDRITLSSWLALRHVHALNYCITGEVYQSLRLRKNSTVGLCVVSSNPTYDMHESLTSTRGWSSQSARFTLPHKDIYY